MKYRSFYKVSYYVDDVDTARKIAAKLRIPGFGQIGGGTGKPVPKIIEYDVDSSNLDKIAYNTAEEKLIVTFNRGAVYEYERVPFEYFVGLRKGYQGSVGKYFNRYIRNKFKYDKMRSGR